MGAAGCSWEQFSIGLGWDFGELGESWGEVREGGEIDEMKNKIKIISRKNIKK